MWDSGDKRGGSCRIRSLRIQHSANTDIPKEGRVEVYPRKSLLQDWCSRGAGGTELGEGAYLDHFGYELVGPRKKSVTNHCGNGAVAYLVSLNPPLLALQRGERMASVMTTSSGFWFCKAAKAAPGFEKP